MKKMLLQRWELARLNWIGFALALAGIITIPTMPAEAVPHVLVTAESGGTQLGQACNGGGNTVGWQFTVGANDLEATALGEFDQNDDGLGMDVEVGLWDSMGTLLGMVTVSSGTGPTLIGDFRYAALGSPVVLHSGQTYTLGSRCTDQNFYAPGNSNYGPLDHASGTVSSDFASAGANGRFNNGGGSTTFSEPTENLGGAGTFFFGPNLQYDVVSPTQTPTQSSPPAPSSTPTPTATLAPPPDAFTCYRAARPRQPSADLAVSLVDEVGATEANLRGPSRLCSALDAADGDVFSERDGLVGYPIVAHPSRRSLQTVSNGYGRQTLTIFGPGRLLVPSATELNRPPAPSTASGLDHFTCYAARAARGTSKYGPQASVTLHDQFGSFAARVGRPKRLCLPATVEGEPAAATDRLLCYRLAPARHVTIGRVFVVNPLGPAILVPRVGEELCVRSTRG